MRYLSLDVLRGLAAFGIMIYHYATWTFGHFQASNPLGRFGVYGVSIFYILSGLTLALIYPYSSLKGLKYLSKFYLKRFFRLFPLLWIILLINVIVYQNRFNISDIVLVFTGLFSVLKWDATTPLGFWSIGNELFFYMIFPCIMYLISLNKIRACVGIFILFLIIHLFFSYKMYGFSIYYSIDWIYKNPLNQVFYFVLGILIANVSQYINISSKILVAILLIALILFCFYPIRGTQFNLFIGNPRLIMTFISCLIVFCFFKLEFEKYPKFIKYLFKTLGDVSYSLYLIHGLVWSFFVFLSIKISFVIPLSILFSLVSSFLLHYYFEIPIKNWGYTLIIKQKK
jgi:exopolysaccharide production protein ExoZ